MTDHEAARRQAVHWLRQLAEKGGKGTVDNIDARALGRCADLLDVAPRPHDAEFVTGATHDKLVTAYDEVARRVAELEHNYKTAVDGWAHDIRARWPVNEERDRLAAALAASEAR